MPVRWTIHSSLVSTMPSSSRLGTTRLGSAAPYPRTTERIMFICILPSRRLGTSRRLVSGMINLQVLGNLFRKSIARHVVANVDRGGETFRIGTAMALDDNAVETE